MSDWREDVRESAQKNAVDFLVLELRTIKRLRELETIGTERLAAGDKRGAAQAVAEYDQLVAMLNQLRAEFGLPPWSA
jgi:hypothetical protein